MDGLYPWGEGDKPLHPPWGKTTSWGVCDTVHGSGVNTRGCRTNPCFPVCDIVWCPSASLMFPTSPNVFFALSDKDGLPPQFNGWV